MADENTDPNAAAAGPAREGNAAGKQLVMHKIYVKDLSFESPKSPDVFRTNAVPQTQLSMRSGTKEMEDGHFEVTLTLTVEAKENDATLFLIEISQAGIFQIHGFTEAERGNIIGSFCPNTLYPYAREAVSDIVSKGGFPQLLLQPINFDALYAQAVQDQRAQAAGAGESPAAPADPHSAGPKHARVRQRRARRHAKKPMTADIAVLGAGSWGTALAIHFARAGLACRLFSRDAGQVGTLEAARCNERYLPDAPFPEALEVTGDLERAADSRYTIIAVPSHAFRATLIDLAALPRPPGRLAWATKGFERETGLMPHQLASELLPGDVRTAVLSGPTFAGEVARGLPSALTVASADADFAHELAETISTDRFRAYTSTDIVGVEVGGATKNVFAIGAGLSDGLGFGANTRIALVTRGLAEMTRLGLALGARRETFMGLAGMGDLVLTATDNLSRNRRFGLALAAGRSVEEALREIGQVVEGYFAARAVHEVAQAKQVDMPIVEQIYRVLHEGRTPHDAVASLMARPIMAESD